MQARKGRQNGWQDLGRHLGRGQVQAAGKQAVPAEPVPQFKWTQHAEQRQQNAALHMKTPCSTASLAASESLLPQTSRECANNHACLKASCTTSSLSEPKCLLTTTNP